jgi:hypothetical protein
VVWLDLQAVVQDLWPCAALAVCNTLLQLAWLLLATVSGYKLLKGGKALVDMLNTALRGTAISHRKCPRVLAVEHHDKTIETRESDNHEVKNASKRYKALPVFEWLPTVTSVTTLLLSLQEQNYTS